MLSFVASGRAFARTARLVLAFFLLLVGVTVGLSPVTAQPVEQGDEAESRAEKVWVFLKTPSASANAVEGTFADAHLATRAALDRRRMRGSSGASALTRPVSHLGALRDAGVVPLVRSRWLNAVSTRLSEDAQTRVAALPFVRRVRPVRTSRVTIAPTESGRALAGILDVIDPNPEASAFRSPQTEDPAPVDSSFYGASYQQLHLMNALKPLQRGLNGRGVTVGFLDSRYRGFRHPTFEALRDEQRLLGTRDYAGGNQISNHGGGVASTTVGYTPGLLIGPAYNASVLAATTEETQFERNVEEDNFVAGLEWLERRGADVVNVSLGYARFDDGQRSYTVDDLDGDTGVTTQAADAAAALGVVMVVSAGNSGCDNPDNCWFYVSTPADADSVITVGAVGPDSTLVDFSSRGPTADGRIKPDVVAMGEGVVAAWGESEYARLNGTSFAGPLVTGVVAQMLQVNPDLEPLQVRRILRQTASQASQPDNEIGWGIVNADAAIREAERAARTSPPSDLVVSAPFPNPASDQTTFPVSVPRNVQARIALYDVLGRRQATEQVRLQPGPNRVPVDVSRLPSGVYLYRIEAGEFTRTGRFAVVQ